MDISALLPLIQMMSGNKNLNIADILNNPAMSGMFKNTDGNSDMLSALMSMMSGGGSFGKENPNGENPGNEDSERNHGNKKFDDILKNMGTSNNTGADFNDILKNMGGNNDMLNMLPLIQSMMGNNAGNNPDILKMLPLVQSMLGQRNRTRNQNQKTEPKPPESKNRFYNLKPISKIANKDITYILNQYFAG